MSSSFRPERYLVTTKLPKATLFMGQDTENRQADLGLSEWEQLFDVTRKVGDARSRLIPEARALRFLNRNFGIRAIARMRFSFEQQQEAEHALVVALFCAPNQLFAEGGNFAVAQLHRYNPNDRSRK
jgi:hypothetical protein